MPPGTTRSLLVHDVEQGGLAAQRADVAALVIALAAAQGGRGALAHDLAGHRELARI